MLTSTVKRGQTGPPGGSNRVIASPIIISRGAPPPPPRLVDKIVLCSTFVLLGSMTFLTIVKYLFTMDKDTQPLSRQAECWKPGLFQGEGPLLEEAQDKVQIYPMLISH